MSTNIGRVGPGGPVQRADQAQGAAAARKPQRAAASAFAQTLTSASTPSGVPAMPLLFGGMLFEAEPEQTIAQAISGIDPHNGNQFIDGTKRIQGAPPMAGQAAKAIQGAYGLDSESIDLALGAMGKDHRWLEPTINLPNAPSERVRRSVMTGGVGVMGRARGFELARMEGQNPTAALEKQRHIREQAEAGDMQARLVWHHYRKVREAT